MFYVMQPNLQPRPKGSADPLKQHACVQVIVQFIDGNRRTFYSRDIDHLNGDKKNYQWVPHWVGYWRNRIEKETPPGWQGRVEEAAIFYSFDGNRGDKIAQWSKAKGGWQPIA